MDVTLSVVAAVVSSVFAFELASSAIQRPRLYAKVWAIAMAFYAAATWALVVGLAFGWSAFGFKVFYLLGAIANIPLLAAGSVALVVGDQWGRRFAWIVAGFVSLGAVAVATAPLHSSVDGVEIPEGSELFGFVIHAGAVSLPGPRVFAIVAGVVGTVVLVGFALVSAFRSWGSNRRLALGNLLIVGGALAPAVGGSMTAVGEGAALALSLAIGAAMLYSGYRVAVAARRNVGVG